MAADVEVNSRLWEKRPSVLPPMDASDDSLSHKSTRVLKNDLLLHEAVIKNDTDGVRKILKEPVDVNSRNNYGRAPIHWASSRGNTEIMDLLINSKCDIEARDKYGMRPILMASWHGHKDAVQMLINCGANVRAVNKKQYTLLICASRNNRLEVVNFLLETLEDLNVDMVDCDQQTALFHAAFSGHTGVVRRLVEVQAQTGVRNKQGQTPLHAACEKGHVEVAEFLLKQGADRDARDEDGNTPLHTAVENQQTQVVQLLLENGTQAGSENSKGYTPLHLASSLGCRGIIDLLVQHGSALNSQSKNGNTPLHVACLSNESATVELLVAKGADINSLNVRLQSPIHIAAEQGYSDICKILLRAGANINQKEQEEKNEVTENDFNAINTGPKVRKWRLSRDEGRSHERVRELLYKVGYKHLDQGEWKRLAYHWNFTEDQIKAIEHQYTGPSSYKEHGFRMLLIWAHGLGPEHNIVKELYESLTAIDKKNVADALRKKLDEENEGKYKTGKRRCNGCSIT